MSRLQELQRRGVAFGAGANVTKLLALSGLATAEDVAQRLGEELMAISTVHVVLMVIWRVIWMLNLWEFHGILGGFKWILMGF